MLFKCERQRGDKDDSRVLVHSTGRGIVNIDMKKIVGTAGLGLGSREIECSSLDMEVEIFTRLPW